MKFNKKTGAEFVSQLQEGATMDMRGISSWSSDYQIASYFSNRFDSDYRFVFKVKNKSGVGIKFLGKETIEGEGNQNTNQGELIWQKDTAPAAVFPAATIT